MRTHSFPNCFMSMHTFTLPFWMILLSICFDMLHCRQAFAQDAWINTRSADHLNVTGIVPLPGEFFTDRIDIFLDDALDPSLEGFFQTEGQDYPVKIEPTLRGTVEIKSNRISIIPTEIKPETVYRFTLHPSLQSKNKSVINPKHAEFAFATNPLSLKRIWEVEQTGEQLKLGIAFTLPVALETLKQNLKVSTDNETEMPLEFEGPETALSCTITVKNIASFPIKITLPSTISDAAGLFSLGQNEERYYPSDRFLTVRESGFHWSDGVKQAVRIVFSAPVHTESFKNYLTLQDEKGNNIPFTNETNGNAAEQVVVYPFQDAMTPGIKVMIGKGLKGEKDRVLQEPYSNSLTRRITREPLVMDYHYFNNQEKDGMSLQMNFNQPIQSLFILDQVKEYLSVSPKLENMKVEFQHNYNLSISGDWVENQSYTILLKEGMPLQDQTTLPNSTRLNIKIDQAQPWAGFDHEGKFYFPKKEGIQLPVYTRYIKELNINVYRLFPSNLAYALKNFNNGNGSSWFQSQYCELIGTVAQTVSGTPHTLSKSILNLDEIIPKDKRGVFALGINDGIATKLVLYTNLGVISHWQNDELAVFTHDLFSLSPVSSAKVSVYSDKFQLTGSAQTDHRGTAHLKDLRSLWGNPMVAVIEDINDFTFLDLEPRSEGTEELQPGVPNYNKEAYDAFVYADRDLYRPGETVHLHWITRTNYGDALANMPLLLQVLKPNGKSLISQPVMLSELGSGGLDIPTQKVYPTGKYTAQLVIPGSKQNVGSYTFRLEEFVPNRMKVDMHTDSPYMIAGQPYSVTVQAQHLFGGPAVDRKCEAEIFFDRSAVVFDQWKGFQFGNDSGFTPDKVSLGEAQSDENGEASFQFNYAAPAELTFPINVSVMGSAYEPGGRAVRGRTTAVIAPNDVLLGLSASQPQGSNQLDVFAAAIHLNQSPSELATVEVTLEKQVWNYYMNRYYNYNRPNFTKSFEPVETKEISLTEGKGQTSFEMNDWGYYRIRLHSKETAQYSTQSFYSYSGRIEAVNEAQPSLIKLNTDKQYYVPGDEAVVRIESPFDGTAFVVVQGEEIRNTFVVTIQDQLGMVKVPIQNDSYPNLWIEATVIRKVDASRAQAFPYSSFTMIPLRVDDPQRQLDVDIVDLPEVMKPDRTTTFKIHVQDHDGLPVRGEVTLAAVDEGIHGISLYRSPDPYRWFSRMRNPIFKRAHYYDQVVYDFQKMSPGGDAGDAMSKRVSPDLESWIQPVALWSGTVQTDDEGNALVEMFIPKFTGALRLDAVAYNETSTGTTSKQLIVKEDHTLQVSLPRFLYPGDTAAGTVVLFNHTDQPCRIHLQWEISGTLTHQQNSADIELSAQTEHRLTIDLSASGQTGQGLIVWTADIVDADGNKLNQLKQETPLPVYQPAAYESQHELIVLKPGESKEIRNTDFLDNEVNETELTVSANPAFQILEAFAHVVGYPYGCVEQTTSKLMPMYVLRKQPDLLKSIKQDPDTLQSYLQSGIDRLFSMQTADGGLGMWPGGNSSYSYGSVYAFHFLTLAVNDRELIVPTENYNALKAYVKDVLMDWNEVSQPAYYNRAYALFTLALSGDLDAMMQLQRFDDVVLPQAARFLLAAALMRNTQDQDKVSFYLANTPSEPYLIAERSGTLNSDIRNTAVEMIALQMAKIRPEQVHEKAKKLMDWLQSNRYGNTQETAFVVTALGAYLDSIAETVDAANADIQLSRMGELQTESINGAQMYSNNAQGTGSVFTVKNTGAADLFVNTTFSGIPKTIQKDAVQKGITIERSFFENKNRIDDSSTLESMKTVVIQLKITVDQNVENVVAVDLLPAGMELQNPRLDPSAVPDETSEGSAKPTYLDIRDDRLILMFDQLSQGTHYYYYAVKTVTPGMYDYPPVQAECMYDASIYGRSGYSKIEVTGQ